MPDVEITIDTRELERALAHTARQIPFATAFALTKTVQAAQKELKDDLPGLFTIRSPWVSNSMRIRPAKKTHLEAQVGSTQAFMEQHRSGAVVPGAVPTKAVRVTEQTRITPAKWPSAFVKKAAKIRLLTDKKGNPMTNPRGGYPGFWQRVGKERLPIRRLYTFYPNTVVPKTWPFDETVEAIFRKLWPEWVVKAVMKVLDTAK